MYFLLVSSLPHSNEGHFESWRNEIKNACDKLGVSFKFFCKDKLEDSNQFLIRLFREAKYLLEAHGSLHIHHEWVHDLTFQEINQINRFCRIFGIKWSTHASISRAFRKTGATGVTDTQSILNELKYVTEIKSIWTWDTFITEGQIQGFKFLPVPDIQDYELIHEDCEICELDVSKYRGVIGLTGQLYGYRGMDKLVSLSQRNSDFLFLAKGKLQPESLAGKTIRLLDEKRSNFYLYNGYIPKSASINHFINHLDALLIDTNRYPDPSGIAIRALNLGKIVFITDNHSFLAQLGKEVPNIHKLRGSRRLSIPKFESTNSLSKFCSPEILLKTIQETLN